MKESSPAKTSGLQAPTNWSPADPTPATAAQRQVLLTDTGRTRLDEVRQNLAAAEARLLTDLHDHDARQLRTLLARVAQTAQRESLAPDESDC
ncbi:hypothetical protein [Streptomyces sp. NPDC056669]|uniref:hypothetical protein n=1 Tax=Streptomyces sp. NPDC056669 TaxID=3345903 RepID=UPI0036C27D6F